MYPKEANEADAEYTRSLVAMKKLTIRYETEALERPQAEDKQPQYFSGILLLEAKN